MPSTICLILLVGVEQSLHANFTCLPLFFIKPLIVFSKNSHCPYIRFSHQVSFCPIATWFLKNQAEPGTVILIYNCLIAVLSPYIEHPQPYISFYTKVFFLITRLLNIFQKHYSALHISGKLWEFTKVKYLVPASKNIKLPKGTRVVRDRN